MNIKFLFLLIFCLIFLPIVSAGENTIYVGENTTTDGQGTSLDPFNNLNLALIHSNDNDTILINDGLYDGVNNTNLEVSKNNLEIKSNGNVTFTGSTIFTVKGNNITLSGIDFVNCTDTVIVNEGNLKVFNSSFYNNHAFDSACIESSRTSMLNVDSCIFDSNNATKIDGGAIANMGVGNIVNSIFINNYAYRDGGAVRNYGAKLTVRNSTFINNTASGDVDGSFGGAIYHWIGEINVYDSTFISNYARDCGGAIHVCKGRMETAYANTDIEGNVFTDNYAKEGGAILLEGCVGKVYQNAFVNNSIDTVCLSDYFIQYFNTTISGNWWGENSPDWNRTITNMNIPDSIVTFNFTVDSTLLKINETTQIGTNFYLNDDIANIPERNISITSNGGELAGDKFHVSVDGIYTLTAAADNEVIKISITVNATLPVLNVSDLEKYYGSSEKLNITLTAADLNPVANATVKITVNGRQYNRTTDADGLISMAINLNSGNYTVIAEYNNSTVNATVTILNTITGENIVKIFKNLTQYYAEFIDSNGNILANGSEVEFNINGVFYKRQTNASGIARLNLNLEQGEYILTAYNPSTGEYLSNNITILPSITDNKDLVKYYCNDSQYVVRIVASDGGYVESGVNVTFNINGVFYTRSTNSTGHVKLNINLNPGDYIITVEYNGCRVSNNISVLAILYADNMVKNYGANDSFKVKLVDGQGKIYPNQSIMFNINGVFYIRYTDSSGIASLNINLMAGEYIITSTYEYSSIANTVIVKEA